VQFDVTVPAIRDRGGALITPQKPSKPSERMSHLVSPLFVEGIQETLVVSLSVGKAYARNILEAQP
jgi:hypothetical protein